LADRRGVYALANGAGAARPAPRLALVAGGR
jgi:hypothetical protein